MPQRLSAILHMLFLFEFKAANYIAMQSNQILLTGISPEQLVELMRPMIQHEVSKILQNREEKLISPAKACEIFKPKISKTTLKSWTDQGLIQKHSLGGRVFYLESEIIASSKSLKKYGGTKN